MPARRRSRCLGSGFSLLPIVLTVAGVGLVGISSSTLADAVSVNSRRGADTAGASALAAAGLNSLYDMIRTTMVANHGTTYPRAPSTPSTLAATMGGATETVGTYSARYVGMPVMSAVDNGSSTTTTWKFTIEGIGRDASTASTSKIIATFTATMVKADRPNGNRGNSLAGAQITGTTRAITQAFTPTRFTAWVPIK